MSLQKVMLGLIVDSIQAKELKYEARLIGEVRKKKIFFFL
jgi:hypothetical protein